MVLKEKQTKQFWEFPSGQSESPREEKRNLREYS